MSDQGASKVESNVYHISHLGDTVATTLVLQWLNIDSNKTEWNELGQQRDKIGYLLILESAGTHVRAGEVLQTILERLKSYDISDDFEIIAVSLCATNDAGHQYSVSRFQKYEKKNYHLEIHYRPKTQEIHTCRCNADTKESSIFRDVFGNMPKMSNFENDMEMIPEPTDYQIKKSKADTGDKIKKVKADTGDKTNQGLLRNLTSMLPKACRSKPRTTESNLQITVKGSDRKINEITLPAKKTGSFITSSGPMTKWRDDGIDKWDAEDFQTICIDVTKSVQEVGRERNTTEIRFVLAHAVPKTVAEGMRQILSRTFGTTELTGEILDSRMIFTVELKDMVKDQNLLEQNLRADKAVVIAQPTILLLLFDVTSIQQNNIPPYIVEAIKKKEINVPVGVLIMGCEILDESLQDTSRSIHYSRPVETIVAEAEEKIKLPVNRIFPFPGDCKSDDEMKTLAMFSLSCILPDLIP